MTNRKFKHSGPDLFQMADIIEERERPLSECRHLEKTKTRTVWPNEKEYYNGYRVERLTWTCNRCGHVWGRC